MVIRLGPRGYGRTTRQARRSRTLIGTAAAGLAVLGVFVVPGLLTPAPGPVPPPPMTALLFAPGAPSSAPAVLETGLQRATDVRGPLLVGPLRSGGEAASLSMAAEGGTLPKRSDDLAAKTQAARQRYEAVMAGTADGTAIDGLHALGQHLHGLPPGSVDVVMVGPVLQVSPDVDLADPVTRADIEAPLAQVTASGLMPACDRWRVHVVGGSADGGVVTDSARDLQAREFWRRLIEQCGGTLSTWDTQLPVFPASAVVPAASFGPACTVPITFSGDVLFAGDQWTVLPAALPQLERLLASLTVTHPDARIVIGGYTADSQDTRFDPYVLSERRAAAVRQWLVDHGVAAERITAEGHGPEDPVADNATESGRELNRRVEVDLQLSPGGCPVK